MKISTQIISSTLLAALLLGVGASNVYAAPKPCVKGEEKKNVTPTALGGKAKGCTKLTKLKPAVTYLTKMGGTNTCFLCHSAAGVAPFNQMANNIFDQGLTLSPADIVTAYSNKISEMTGAPSTITLAEAARVALVLKTTKAK